MEKSKENNQENMSEFLRTNFFRVSAIVVAIVNLWIVTKLAPISQNIAIIEQRVTAIEQAEPITNREFDSILKRLDRIDTRLSRIENRL